MSKTTKFLEDYYYEHYYKQDKKGKAMLTNQLNALLENVPPKALAMSLVALVYESNQIDFKRNKTSVD